jgi:hypothetical protein
MPSPARVKIRHFVEAELELDQHPLCQACGQALPPDRPIAIAIVLPDGRRWYFIACCDTCQTMEPTHTQTKS